MTASETYIQQLIALQTRLYAYILTLLADRTAADDVLQETNLVLYRKAGEFAEGADFEPWAFSIARTQCLAFWKLRGRDRLVLGDDAIDRIACRAEAGLEEIDSQRTALRQCLGSLPARQRELVEARYAIGGSVNQLAHRLGRPESSVSQALYRIRCALLNCVQRRLSQEGEKVA
jgi:RNA polymerase sigma-70 factor (ECF subfamily)